MNCFNPVAAGDMHKRPATFARFNPLMPVFELLSHMNSIILVVLSNTIRCQWVNGNERRLQQFA